MADGSKHTSTFLDLHKLYSSPRSSHVLGSTILEQQFLSNPAVFAQRNSFNGSAKSSSSSFVTPKKQMHPCEQNPVSYNILQGCIGISKLAMFPMQRVSILMQCQNEMLNYGHLSSPYKGMKDCLLRTIKHEGVLSLWRGSSGLLAIQALNFAVSLRLESPPKEAPEVPLWFVPVGMMVALLPIHPLEYVQTRLATDVKAARDFQFYGRSFSNAVGDRMFRGALDVFKKTLKSDGIFGLYRGYTIAWVGYSAFYQVNKEISSHEKQTKEITPPVPLLTPAAFLCQPLFYPVMTICRRMMLTSGEAMKYKGAVDAFRQIVKHEGVSSLYKGVGAFTISCAAADVIVLAFFYTAIPKIEKLLNIMLV